MTKTELLKLKPEIEAELAAVETLLKRFEEPRLSLSKEIFKSITPPNKSASQCAEEIIRKMPGNFNITNVEKEMQVMLGRKSINFRDIARQAIHFLCKRKEVQAVIPGAGSRGGIYRVITK